MPEYGFGELRARSALLEQLFRPAQTGRIAHARIFTGPHGTGKKTAALTITKAVNCTGSKKPCGKCPYCIRFDSGDPIQPLLSDWKDSELIRTDALRNIVWVRPGKTSIKVDAIRELIEELSLMPESGMKCAIIDQAERMNESAQNALLKTLEEAPSYVLFFLITERYTALLPTIRSRCAVLRFAPLEVEEVRQYLRDRGYAETEADSAARMSGGAIGRALEFLRDKKYAETAAALVPAFKDFKTKKDVARVAAEFGAFKDSARLLLEILENAAHELMIDSPGQPAQVLKQNGIDGASLMAAVIKCTGMINANVAFQSAIEMLLYDIAD